jgi:hypothetical protein
MSPPKGYPVEWEGKTLYMGPLSADVKRAFADWVKPRALAAARRLLDGAEYLQFRQEVIGIEDEGNDAAGSPGSSIYWTATPAMAVATALQSKAGQTYLNRLLYGKYVEDWPDADLWAFLKAKDRRPPTEADPDPVQSDHAVAFDLVWAEQDPKVPRPSGGTGGRAGTTDSWPTSPPSTPSASPAPMPAA